MRPGLAGSHFFAELDDESDSGEDQERQDQPEDQEATLHPYAIQAAAGAETAPSAVYAGS